MRASSSTSSRSRSPAAGRNSLRAARITVCALESRSAMGMRLSSSCASHRGTPTAIANVALPKRSQRDGTRVTFFDGASLWDNSHRATSSSSRSSRSQSGIRSLFRLEISMTRSSIERQAVRSYVAVHPRGHGRAAHFTAITLATGNCTLPLPPPTSTRILASSKFPSGILAAFHASKC
jgi:hypothetical protein